MTCCALYATAPCVEDNFDDDAFDGLRKEREVVFDWYTVFARIISTPAYFAHPNF
jgi:hypothetical protein